MLTVNIFIFEKRADLQKNFRTRFGKNCLKMECLLQNVKKVLTFRL